MIEERYSNNFTLKLVHTYDQELASLAHQCVIVLGIPDVDLTVGWGEMSQEGWDASINRLDSVCVMSGLFYTKISVFDGSLR